jgi:hypothetical protein
MGVVMRVNGWRFVIYTDDHEPPHVHARRPGGHVKIHLLGPGGLPDVVKIHRLPDHEAWRALAMVCEHQQFLLEAWSNIHG